LQQQLLIIQ